MDILSLITSQLNNPDVLNQLGSKVGANPDQVQKLAQLGLPTMLEALNRNASNPEGAQALAGALDKHQIDNVDDISGFLNNVDINDGTKILGHMFSDKNDRVQNNLSQQTGLAGGQVTDLLAQLAPLLLGAMGTQKKQQGLDAGGVAGLTSQLTGMMGQSGGGNIMNMASKFLDADNDGSIIDDVGGLLGKFFKR